MQMKNKSEGNHGSNTTNIVMYIHIRDGKSDKIGSEMAGFASIQTLLQQRDDSMYNRITFRKKLDIQRI